MSKCKKPNCDCVERAEMANGGEPVKYGYPCLYGNDDEMVIAAQQKSPQPVPAPNVGEDQVRFLCIENHNTGNPRCVAQCDPCKDHVTKKIVAAQQGEVPEELMVTVIEILDQHILAHGGEYGASIFGMREAAELIASYWNRDQEHIKALQHELDCARSETLGYKKVYALVIQERNEVDERIKTLQSQVANMQDSMRISGELVERQAARILEMEQELEKYKSIK